MGQTETKETTGKKDTSRDAMTEWIQSCGSLLKPSQWDDTYTGQFLQRRPWKDGLPVLTTLEIECQKEVGGQSMRLKPMRFLTPVYREWLQDKSIRDLLSIRIKWWIQQQITEKQDDPLRNVPSSSSSVMQPPKYTPLDYHLLMQLVYDLDMIDEMETIRQHAETVARMYNWSWRVHALWKQIF